MLALAFSGLAVLYNYRRTHKTMVVSKTKEGTARLTTTNATILDLTKEVVADEKKN
ncbi:MAG: hypothetical protein IPM85_13395 [Chitinophagaceae bacterium]|nr:hypothetical protein [Chitinophagaceae bacterium]